MTASSPMDYRRDLETEWPRVQSAIERRDVEQVAPEAFRTNYYGNGNARPVIIRARNVYGDLKARWTDEFLRREFGNTDVHVYVSTDGTFPGGDGPYDPSKYRIVAMSFGECLDRINGNVGQPILSTSERCYLYQCPAELFAGMLSDYTNPPYVPRDGETNTNIWLSGAGAVTPPHWDLADNILVQIRGAKQVLLWSPDQYPYLYLTPLGEVHSRQSPIEPERRRSDKFPAFVNANALSGNLEWGDMLFIPAGWTHYIKTVESSISINHWWTTEDFRKLLNATNEILHSCRMDLQVLSMYLIGEKCGKLVR